MAHNVHPLLTTPEWQHAVRDQNSGRFQQAEQQYLAMARRAPDCPELYCNLAILKNLEGNYGMALALANHAVSLSPHLVDAVFLAGNALLAAGRAKEAEAKFRIGVKQAPKLAEGYFHLGNALGAQGQQDEAEKAFRKALKLNPKYAEAWLNLGNILRDQRRLHEALEACEQCVASQPDYAYAHNNLGNVLRDLDRLPEAEAAYKRAVELAPNYDTAHFNLGNALRDQGKVQEAVASFRNAIAINPLHGDAQRHLAITDKVKPMHPDIVAMRQVFQDPGTPDLQRMFMAFGLGFVHDKAGEYEQAFRYFDVGNRLKRSTLNYSADSDARLMEQIREAHNTSYLAPQKPCGTSPEAPILILGMMRSGTSLMEQILACHSQIEGGGELLTMPALIDPPGLTGKPRSFPHSTLKLSGKEWDELGRSYVSKVRQRLETPTPYFTDKLPQNFLYLGAFARALPRTRVLHMVRNPLDVCLSIYSQLFTEGHPYAYNLQELGRYYIGYHRLMQHWRTVCPNMIMDVSYAQLVDNTEATVREVLEFLDLPFEPACLDYHTSKRSVKTASALQVREKIYKTSKARWRNYKSQLAPLMRMFDEADIDYRNDLPVVLS